MKASEFIAKWHQRVADRDLPGITEMLAEDISFSSPAFFKPYTGKEFIAFLLSQVVELIPDFRYVASYDNPDGGIVLQFEGTLPSDGRDYRVEGVDILKLDDAGRVIEFVVMIRPLRTLQALASEMKRRLGG